MATMSWRYVLLPSTLYWLAVTAAPQLHPRAITAACTAGETDSACITGNVPETVKTGVVSGTTVTETFYSTSLSDFASITAPTTVTTVDASGATVVAYLAAAGVGWLAIEGAGTEGAALLLDPPEIPPAEPPGPTPTSAAQSSSSSEALTITATQSRLVYGKTFDAPPPRVTIAEDVRSCNAAGAKDPTVQLVYANNTLHDFCMRHTDEELLGGPAEELFSLGAGVELNVSVSVNVAGCTSDEGQTLLDEYDCEAFLTETLNGCDTNSNKAKHGGSVDDGCFHYSVTPSFSNGNLTCADPNLPSLPSTDNKIKYAADTGFDRDEAYSHIGNFCANITWGYDPDRHVVPNNETGLRIYYNPSKGNDQMKIQLDYNEDQSCPQSGADAFYPADFPSCVRFLGGRIIDGCNTNYQPPYGKFGGTLTDACGVYSIQTKNVEPFQCGSPPNVTPATISEDTANAAIDQFCSRGYHLDPKVTIDPTKFYQTPPDGAAWDYYYTGTEVVYMDARFGSLAQNTECQAQQTRFAIDGDECKRRLHTIVNQCAAGGQMGAQQGEGCVLWEIYVYGV